METPGSGGAGLGDAISTETAAAPGCGRDVPGTGYRGGRNEVSARPWCEAMKTKRFREHGLPLFPGMGQLGESISEPDVPSSALPPLPCLSRTVPSRASRLRPVGGWCSAPLSSREVELGLILERSASSTWGLEVFRDTEIPRSQ